MTSVLGLGNVLMGDDGFGPAAVRLFRETFEVGRKVVVADVSTPGLDLMPWLVGADRVILVDTVKGNLPPGTIRVFDKVAMLRHGSADRMRPHDIALKHALSALDLAGCGPRELALIGVQPGRVGMGMHLSIELSYALPLAVEGIAALLKRFGEHPIRRTVFHEERASYKGRLAAA
jgi:hydrogenase maturation protease